MLCVNRSLHTLVSAALDTWNCEGRRAEAATGSDEGAPLLLQN